MINYSQQNRVTQRFVGLDIVRSFAIFSVIAGHYFSLHTNFRTETFHGTSMFLQAIFGNFFDACGVPLFLLLTGYCNTHHTLEASYFRKIYKVLVSYLLFSIIAVYFRNVFLNEQLNIKQAIDLILSFKALPYAWYIEMWIGLFLITPFLNIMYHGIEKKNHKEILILILLFLTALPDLMNRYGVHIIPAYWQNCYPLTFYFIGVYINEYKPQIGFLKGILLIISICLINPIFNLLFIHNHDLVQITGGGFGLFGFIIAVTTFLLLYHMGISSIILKTLFFKTANFSLDMYLCCWFFDALLYPYFKSLYFVNQSQFGKYFFIIVPSVLIFSFIVAWFKDFASIRLKSIK